MYLPRFDPYEMYLAFIYIILSSIFSYKELKMAYQPWFTFYHIILTVKKFWAVFVSFWAGNRYVDLFYRRPYEKQLPSESGFSDI